MDIKYSIIIPHKNAPELLSRCLNSIPEREDVQVIIIDDNSKKELINTNNYPGINRLNNEIVFLDEKTSKGAGRARNIGLEKAKGQWVLFADADDYFTDYLPKLLDKYKNDDKNDVVYLNSQIVTDKNEVKPGFFSGYFERYKRGEKYSEAVLRYYMWTPWSRMVKKSLIDDNNLQFDEIPVANDRFFSLSCSRYAKAIAVEDTIVYNYYKPDDGSITDKYATKSANVLSRLNTQLKVNTLYAEVHFPFQGSFILQFLSYVKIVENKRELCTIFYQFVHKNKINILTDLYNLVRRQIAKQRGIL